METVIIVFAYQIKARTLALNNFFLSHETFAAYNLICNNEKRKVADSFYIKVRQCKWKDRLLRGPLKILFL